MSNYKILKETIKRFIEEQVQDGNNPLWSQYRGEIMDIAKEHGDDRSEQRIMSLFNSIKANILVKVLGERVNDPNLREDRSHPFWDQLVPELDNKARPFKYHALLDSSIAEIARIPATDKDIIMIFDVGFLNIITTDSMEYLKGEDYEGLGVTFISKETADELNSIAHHNSHLIETKVEHKTFLVIWNNFASPFHSVFHLPIEDDLGKQVGKPHFHVFDGLEINPLSEWYLL